MSIVNIPDELKEKIEEAVKNGACCSVDHLVERTLKAAL
jgi:Arc/MetJ-type ribon-helix-helix transcriptional regulator